MSQQLNITSIFNPANNSQKNGASKQASLPTKENNRSPSPMNKEDIEMKDETLQDITEKMGKLK
jgi:hypothetical protein